MKFKTTKKVMKNQYNTIVTISYCSLQTLLKFENAIAYSTRVEGWACDYYEHDGVLISTGYAPISGIRPSYEIVKQYEEKARVIVSNYDSSYDEQKAQLQTLLSEFISEVTTA